MRYLPLLLIFVTTFAFGETINEKYSYKAFPYHGLSFKDRPASEFNNTTIRRSCFYQEWAEGDTEIIKDIFPLGMVGVIFEECNLDNVLIPLGNTNKNSINKKIKAQNDLEDWVLDNSLKPKEPMNKEQRLKAGVSIDPKDIPSKKFTKEEKYAFDESVTAVSINP